MRCVLGPTRLVILYIRRRLDHTRFFNRPRQLLVLSVRPTVSECLEVDLAVTASALYRPESKWIDDASTSSTSPTSSLIAPPPRHSSTKPPRGSQAWAPTRAAVDPPTPAPAPTPRLPISRRTLCPTRRPPPSPQPPPPRTRTTARTRSSSSRISSLSCSSPRWCLHPPTRASESSRSRVRRSTWD